MTIFEKIELQRLKTLASEIESKHESELTEDDKRQLVELGHAIEVIQLTATQTEKVI